MAGAFGTKTSQSSQSTSTNTQNLDPHQTQLNKALWKKILGMVYQGPTVSEADRNALRGQINRAYTGAEDAATSSLISRGYGASGGVPRAVTGGELARAGAISAGETSLSDQAFQRFMSAASEANQLLIPRSSTSTSSSTGTGTQSPGIGSILTDALGLGLGVNWGNLFSGQGAF